MTNLSMRDLFKNLDFLLPRQFQISLKNKKICWSTVIFQEECKFTNLLIKWISITHRFNGFPFLERMSKLLWSVESRMVFVWMMVHSPWMNCTYRSIHFCFFEVRFFNEPIDGVWWLACKQFLCDKTSNLTGCWLNWSNRRC
ncbi:unnamed protein product [Lactuca saligna]|uniref:Uncharacterized protein n=1 Tax=Lactuca saligna TaxID=75948 RepID=A0AA36E327_LACSI|nr:unnamed protein product [Lactuca saligna]